MLSAIVIKILSLLIDLYVQNVQKYVLKSFLWITW